MMMKLVKRSLKEFLIAIVVTLLITSAIVGGAGTYHSGKKTYIAGDKNKTTTTATSNADYCIL